MTEEEAKTKWCPMVRIGVGEGSSTNLSWVSSPEDLQKADNNCLASACMMWRETAADDGYCGLAPMAASQPLQGMSIPTSIMRGKLGEPIGKGVYNNPQPGDADHGKTDIGSGG